MRQRMRHAWLAARQACRCLRKHNRRLQPGVNTAEAHDTAGPIAQNAVICDAGLPHPPPPPPDGIPLACQVGSCLVWACCFPRLVLFGLVPSHPPRCGVGPVIFLVGPTPPAEGSVFYRGMVRLLPLVSSNVIVTCLVPSPPVGWGLWSFWLAPPSLCGAVCSTEYGMVAAACSCNAIVTCSLPYKI